MNGLNRAARDDVERCVCIYPELGIPRTTPRKTIISLLKKYAMNFHPDKTNSRTDISEERKEEMKGHWLRCSAVKASVEDELKHFVYNKAL